ncbi:MAG: trypsin-like peptidase domain-containing protein [Candidatus Saccharibacteria bacterium]
MKSFLRLSTIVITALLLVILQDSALGQLSQGGTPVQVQKLKSLVTDDVIVLPSVDNEQERQASMDEQQQSGLKAFHFAHPFDVSLNLANSGEWYDAGTLKVWQLSIRSTGAYSLNVIFGKFHLPEKARLFVIGAKSGIIKGAYTADNNSSSQVLAVEPVAGDELLIQYEEPAGVAFPGQLELSRISHDFTGAGAPDDHRPLGISGSCNVNVNCNSANGTEEIKDAVCRIIVEGEDICTGTFVNNTANDGTPYLLTAYHCISTEHKANSTVFLFNYESPACTSIDADVSRSLSGSSLKAAFDSLDFALVRLSSAIPYAYRPYLAGWNRKSQAPSSTKTIHHPLGDIKKISTDKDIPATSSYSSNYHVNSFWKILRWDTGTTENGSSGGPLFDQNNLLVGSLTGGSATCSLPTNDFFSKLALAWDYRKENYRQLKAWLDPSGTNATTLAGRYLYTQQHLCQPVTNFSNEDTYSLKRIPKAGVVKEYFSGTNNSGYSEFAEQYTFAKSCEVEGISLGIAIAKTNSSFATSMLSVNVYEGTDQPGKLVYSQDFDINKLYPDAMNYLAFTTPVNVSGNFFVGYNISKLHSGDTLAVYTANRSNSTLNSFFLKSGTNWASYNSRNTAGNGSALLTELIACNIDNPTKIDSFDSENVAHFYPNPLRGNILLSVVTKEELDTNEAVKVYDLLGKEQNIPFVYRTAKKLLLNFSGKRPGIYFVHIKAGGRTIVGKIAYIR